MKQADGCGRGGRDGYGHRRGKRRIGVSTVVGMGKGVGIANVVGIGMDMHDHRHGQESAAEAGR